MTDIEKMYFPCCKIFRELFAWKNMEGILKIMKFSWGMPLLKSLKETTRMDPAGYQNIFPNDGNTNHIAELG